MYLYHSKLCLVRLLFKEINTFIQQGHTELIKDDSKGIYNSTKDFL